MTPQKATSLIDFQPNIKTRLSTLWTSLMFLYIYADYFELMTPGKLEAMMKLQTPMGETTPTLLILFSILLIIPALMIYLSLSLRPVINKWMNIIFAILYGLISLLIISLDIGHTWSTFFVLYNLVELVIFSLIIYHAVTWPKEAI